MPCGRIERRFPPQGLPLNTRQQFPRKEMNTLCRIRDIQRAVNEFEARFEKTYGICLNEGMLLCSLEKEEFLCSGKLGELLGLSASNTSKVIRNAEEKGYITRVLGKTDRRQMYFSLSRKGRELLAELHCGQIAIPPLLESCL